jgi:hypothetical protein
MAMTKTLQCKDIPDRPILEFLAGPLAGPGGIKPWHLGASWHDLHPRSEFTPTVRDAMPSGIPDKLVLGKMRMLIRRGLVSGCDCGCRGDFTITEAGRRYLAGTLSLA